MHPRKKTNMAHMFTERWLLKCSYLYFVKLIFVYNIWLKFCGFEKLWLDIGLISIYEICTYISLYQIFSFWLLEGNIDGLDFSNFDRAKKSVIEEMGNLKIVNWNFKQPRQSITFSYIFSLQAFDLQITLNISGQ